MSYLEQNIGYLSKSFPQLAPRVLAAADDLDLEILTTRSANPSLVYRGHTLYSRYDPLKETRRWLDGLVHNKSTCAVFLGFGLAYQIEYYLELKKNASIVIVEPDTAFLKAVFAIRDFKELLTYKRLSIVLGENLAELHSSILRVRSLGVQLFQLRSVYELNPKYYRACQELIYNLLSRSKVNENTINHFAPLWCRNITANIIAIMSAMDIGVFYDSALADKKLPNDLEEDSQAKRQNRAALRDFPALLVAAGPSLEQQVPYLHEYRKRMLIVCVDTALTVLLKHGIQPDFVVCVDSQFLNSRHFDFCRAPKSILLADATAYPAILRLPWARIAMFHSSLPLLNAIEQRIGLRHNLHSGGSVATAAWDFIRRCGIKNVYSIGLDLSYPSLRSHASQTLMAKLGLLNANRLKPYENSNWQSIMGRDTIRLPSFSKGTTVRTDRRMQVYLNWLEERIIKYKDIMQFWTLSPRTAAQIKGAQVAEAGDLLELELCRSAIDKQLAGLLESNAVDSNLSSKKKKIRRYLQRIYNALGSLQVDSKEALRQLESGAKHSNLSILTKAKEQEEERRLAAFLFTPLMDTIAKKSHLNELDDKSPEFKLMYQGFVESTEFLQLNIKKALSIINSAQL